MEDILEKINRSAIKFLTPLTPQETYKMIVKEALKLVKADTGSIILRTGGQLKSVYNSSKKRSRTIPRKKGWTYESIVKRKAFILYAEEFEKIHPEIKEDGFNSSIFIPLFYRSKSIGALIVKAYHKTVLTERELEILKIYGSMASLAIRNIQLLDETQNALYTRDLFISVASHELKTPLTAMNGYIQLLQKKIPATLTKERDWADNLARESKRLTKLINELLELNQVKTGNFQYNFKSCTMKEIVVQAIDNFKFNYPDRLVSYKDEIEGLDDTIIGDCDKLVQVITNILNNAAKFSSKEYDIILTLTEKNPYIQIKVQDSGIGISSEDLKHVFDGFYKGKHGVKEGMGLGLYLSKLIIDQHRGKITIESEEQKGTTIEIKLPKAKYE
jgi:signal transduction histidine kinase